jgi:hypothetical protein
MKNIRVQAIFCLILMAKLFALEQRQSRRFKKFSIFIKQLNKGVY